MVRRETSVNAARTVAGEPVAHGCVGIVPGLTELTIGSSGARSFARMAP
jgi:hypothetical protein